MSLIIKVSLFQRHICTNIGDITRTNVLIIEEVHDLISEVATVGGYSVYIDTH